MAEDFLNTFEVGDDLFLELLIDQEPQVLKAQVLESVSAHKVIISCPIFKGRVIALNIGERYKITHNSAETGVFQFVGLIVLREKTDQIHRLHVLRVSDVRREQRREFFRLSLVEDAQILVENGEEEESFIHQGAVIKQVVPKFDKLSAIVKDISAGGIRVNVKQSFQIGDEVNVKFDLDSQKYDLKGQIVRCFRVDDVVERYDLGIKFINIEQQLQRSLVAVIFEKQRRMLKKGMV